MCVKLKKGDHYHQNKCTQLPINTLDRYMRVGSCLSNLQEQLEAKPHPYNTKTPFSWYSQLFIVVMANHLGFQVIRNGMFYYTCFFFGVGGKIFQLLNPSLPPADVEQTCCSLSVVVPFYPSPFYATQIQYLISQAASSLQKSCLIWTSHLLIACTVTAWFYSEERETSFLLPTDVHFQLFLKSEGSDICSKKMTRKSENVL